MKNVLVAASFLVIAAPVSAQTIEQVAPTGPRIEARVGWDRPVVTLEATDGTDRFKESAGKSGVSYGGEIGWDFNAGQYTTIGVYAGIDGSSTKECLEIYGGDEGCIKLGRNLSAGVRGGILISHNSLFYVKGGYSNGRARLTYDDPAFPEDNFDYGANRDGFHLGTGAEIAFAKNFYGKAEYVYTNYNGLEARDGVTVVKLDADRHQVVAGFGVRF